MPWYPHLLYYWRLPPLNLPQVICTHLFLFMIICENLSLLWESFLFMRISSYLWSSVGVFSFYENFFLFMIICKNLFCLWESLLIYNHLWESLLIYDQKSFYCLFFITFTYLCILILIFFYHSKSILICIHSSQ